MRKSYETGRRCLKLRRNNTDRRGLVSFIKGAAQGGTVWFPGPPVLIGGNPTVVDANGCQATAANLGNVALPNVALRAVIEFPQSEEKGSVWRVTRLSPQWGLTFDHNLGQGLDGRSNPDYDRPHTLVR